MSINYTPRLPHTNVNVSNGSLMKDLALMLGGAAAVLAAVYFALGLAIDFVAPRVSYETELKLARWLGENPMVRHADPAPPALAELAEAVRTRATGIDHPVRVLVLDIPALNAFALPGGALVLTRGILDAMDSENELVYILGHELGHVEHRDHLRGLGRMLVLMALSSLVQGGESGPGKVLGSMAQLSTVPFSRAQELAADAAGQDALMALYGNVTGAVSIMEKLAAGDEGSWLLRLGASHPETRERIRRLKERADKLGYPQGPTRPMPDLPQPPPAEHGGSALAV